MSEDENTLDEGEQEPCLNESKTDLDRHSVVNKPHEKATAFSRGASEDGRSDLESCGSSVGKDADDSQGGAAYVSVDGAEEEVGPVDEGYSWVILVAAAFVIMGFPINNLSFGVFLDAFIDYYQLPQAVLGLMGAVRTCIIFLTGAVTSPFIARYGCRPVAIFGVLLSTLGNALASMATSYGFLFFSFAILAPIGGGCMYIPSQVIVQQYFRKHRAIAAGISTAGMSFAALSMSPVMRLSIEEFGFRGGLLMVAAMSLQCLVPCMMLRPHPRTAMKHKTNIEPPEQKQVESQVAKPANYAKRIYATLDRSLDFSLLKRWDFLLFVTSCVPNSTGIAIYNAYAIQKAIYSGVSPILASFVNTTLGSGSVLGRLVSGSLGNLSCTNRIAQFSISTGLLGVVVLIAIYDTSSAAFHLTIAGICGYFVGSYQALFATVAVDIVSLERLPHAMGWIQLARAMACMLVIPIGGWLYDIFGSYTTTFIFAGVTQKFEVIEMYGCTFMCVSGSLSQVDRTLENLQLHAAHVTTP
uniref:Major facilitator superfamily (MFS) profile domain-containing protein n=1 Tax=Capitella teleta TaxID=283909 RepID=X2AU40_CAPTE